MLRARRTRARVPLPDSPPDPEAGRSTDRRTGSALGETKRWSKSSHVERGSGTLGRERAPPACCASGRPSAVCAGARVARASRAAVPVEAKHCRVVAELAAARLHHGAGQLLYGLAWV